MVSGSVNSTKNEGSATMLNVQLNAAQPDKNQVASIRFKSDNLKLSNASKVILQVKHFRNRHAVMRRYIYRVQVLILDGIEARSLLH